MATKRLKRPRDPIALAKLIGDIATRQVQDAVEDKRDPAAVVLGRHGVLRRPAPHESSPLYAVDQRFQQENGKSRARPGDLFHALQFCKGSPNATRHPGDGRWRH